MPMRDAIEACETAHRRCTEAAIHAMQQGGNMADWSLVHLLLDGADMTETCADFLLRSSRLHQPVARVTAEIADRCARDCELLAANDLRMRECAEACRLAASQCRLLV